MHVVVRFAETFTVESDASCWRHGVVVDANIDASFVALHQAPVLLCAVLCIVSGILVRSGVATALGEYEDAR